ncbi:phosphatase PAP2 family protein [Pontibacter sp. JH31]|uniref:Phosphatase PAP2 family protein n=1 Tax=Pontibacter aquaedesilientis TaxID=2766980 RepID=A0ABR7XDT1_9BACT|nr:phosphatase PAP2 family protein [Pontibacter aquaedesilientis]MBD1396439.1 phosphatase PAP2 family protein [Pontibacter aquaedesilientis]
MDLLLLVMASVTTQVVYAQLIPAPRVQSVETHSLQSEPIITGRATGVDTIRLKLSPVAKGAAVLVAGAGVWTATFALADEPLQQFTQSHRTTFADQIAYVVQPLGRQGYLMPAAGLAFAGGLAWQDTKLQKAGLVAMASILISSGVTSTLKKQFHRYRPNITTENHIFNGAAQTSSNTSLPSAHTTTAFAVATTVASVYGDENKYVPPIAYGVATLVGLSRINDNAHWATDVMAGALVGYLSAKGTLYLYEVANQKLNIRKHRLQVNPQLGLRSGGVNATLVF